MIEHDKQSSHSLEQQPTPVEPENFQAAAGRRHFLKGLSVGLPAVMTLYHGAALANASNLTCLTNRPNNVNPLAGGPLALAPTTQGGGYVTTQSSVQVRQYTRQGNHPSYTYYFDSVDNVWRSATDGTEPEGQSLSTSAQLDTYVTTTYGSPYSGKNITSPSEYAYAWIGDDGVVYALGNDNKLSGPGRELPATFSCWASSHP